MTVQDAREALAWRTRRGVNNLLAAFLLWTTLAVVSFFLDYPEQKAIAFLLGAVALWPLALLAGWLLRLELVPHGNPLGGLYLLVCALQIPFAPLLLGAALATPGMVPWYVGIVAGAQCLLFAWIYGSYAYLFCGLGILEVASLTGWLTPAATYFVTPILVIAILLFSFSFVARENAASRMAPDARPVPVARNA